MNGRHLVLISLGVVFALLCIASLKPTGVADARATAAPVPKEVAEAQLATAILELKKACNVQLGDLAALRHQWRAMLELTDGGQAVPDSLVIENGAKMGYVKRSLREHCGDVVDPIIMQSALDKD